MIKQTAVIIGASGLIGSHLVEQMLKDDFFGIVRVLVRKELQLTHKKLEQEIVDFSDFDDYTKKFGEGDVIFCCIGTTNKKVNGDKAAYEKTDFTIPSNAATIALNKSYKKFLMVSSVGANINSKSFYLKLKGRIENALKEFPFESISIFRPGQLLGKRNEYRRAEYFTQGVTQFISNFLFGSLKKYHSIAAEKVAKAMIAQSKKPTRGVHILEYDEMVQLIR
jgi:uncharacterized protein YbjT (DUF2867 family)